MKNHDSAGDGALILSFSVKEGHKIRQGMPEVDEIVTIFRYSVYPLKNRTLGWSVSGKAKAYWLTPLDILLPLKHRTHPSEKWEGKLKNSGIPIAITLPLIKDMNLWIPSFASLGGMPMPIKGQKSIFCAMYILMKSNVFSSALSLFYIAFNIKLVCCNCPCRPLICYCIVCMTFQVCTAQKWIQACNFLTAFLSWNCKE